MLRIIFDCCIFVVSGRQRATLGSDSDNTDTVCIEGVIYFR